MPSTHVQSCTPLRDSCRYATHWVNVWMAPVRMKKAIMIPMQISRRNTQEKLVFPIALIINWENPRGPWPDIRTPTRQATAREYTAFRVVKASTMARAGGTMERMPRFVSMLVPGFRYWTGSQLRNIYRVPQATTYIVGDNENLAH